MQYASWRCALCIPWFLTWLRLEVWPCCDALLWGACAQVVSGAEQAAAAEAGAGGELLGAFNVATFAGEVGCLRPTGVQQSCSQNSRQDHQDAALICQKQP